MALELMYITNSPKTALIAEESGVERIWIDLEFIGKEKRQKNLDSVKSKHTIQDIQIIKGVLTKSLIQVRINPIYFGSEKEINDSIAAGVDYIMLPMFKTKEEVETFIHYVNHRAKTILLFETKESVEHLDEILNIDGIDEIHIGLNDLHLSYKKRFLFELLIDGTVEFICKKAKQRQIPYGFGGIASLGKGVIPAEMIMAEHYRLGSTRAILSRSFCNVEKIKEDEEIRSVFMNGLQEIRNFEEQLKKENKSYFLANRTLLEKRIKEYINEIRL